MEKGLWIHRSRPARSSKSPQEITRKNGNSFTFVHSLGCVWLFMNTEIILRFFQCYNTVIYSEVCSFLQICIMTYMYSIMGIIQQENCEIGLAIGKTAGAFVSQSMRKLKTAFLKVSIIVSTLFNSEFFSLFFLCLPGQMTWHSQNMAEKMLGKFWAQVSRRWQISIFLHWDVTVSPPWEKTGLASWRMRGLIEEKWKLPENCLHLLSDLRERCWFPVWSPSNYSRKGR